MNKKKEIKKVIEQILGSNITMRDDKPPEDMLKEEFVNIIERYEGIWKRQNDLLENQGIDFSSYDDDYFKVIEGMVNFCFDDGAAEGILFYVYSRKDEEGNTLPFIDKNGMEHYFESIDDLWEFLLYWAEEIMKL